jgi:8-oxo-dGTP pyrophosphatase MutT (NUDIX family)
MSDKSAGPIRRGVVGIVVRGDRLLVIRRSETVEAPGTYCFPGGGIEAGESESAALKREFAEELRVAVRPLRGVWQSRTAWNVDLSWWLADLAPDATLLPDPREVASVHWLTVPEMRREPSLLSSNHAFLDALQRGEFSLDSFGTSS